MSHATSLRLLRRIEQKRGLARSPYVEAVYAVERPYEAARIFAKFARLLAGTDQRPVASLAPAPIDSGTETAPRVDPAPPRSHWPVWSETVRPGPHDVLTWAEVIRVPWIEGNAAHQQGVQQSDDESEG